MSWILSCNSGRDKEAAKTFFHKPLKGLTYVPRVIVTDQLKSYEAAKQEVLPVFTTRGCARGRD